MNFAVGGKWNSMNIEILLKRVENESSVKQFVHEKVENALSEIDARIDRVVVKLEDESRGSEAFDGLCRIDAWLHPTGHVHISANGDSAFDSVLQAVRKLEHTIKEKVVRERRSSRIRHEGVKREFISSLSAEEEAALKDKQTPE